MACASTVAGYEHAGYDLQGVCCAFIPGQGLGGLIGQNYRVKFYEC